MNGSIALLDASVPMYAAGKDHPYKKSCSWIMIELAEGRLAAGIDTETTREVFYRFGSLR